MMYSGCYYVYKDCWGHSGTIHMWCNSMYLCSLLNNANVNGVSQCYTKQLPEAWYMYMYV